MQTFIVAVILFISVLLILVILAQKPKGGGLIGEASRANQVMGARRATDWIEKATWGLTTGLFALCLLVNVFIDRGPTSGDGLPSSPNIERAKSEGGASMPNPGAGINLDETVPAEDGNLIETDGTNEDGN